MPCSTASLGRCASRASNADRRRPNDPGTGLPDCCIAEWDGNRERFLIDTDGLLGAQPLWVTSKVALTNVAGPLDYTFGEYKVLAAPVAGPNMSAVPVPDPSPNEFTIAGYNITFFVGFEPQLSKAALHIRDVMKYPDVIGMVEIASLAALQALANRVNADAGAASPGYAAYLTPFGSGSQHVGFLVKSSRVLVESVTQEQTEDTFIDPTNGVPETTHDRPPLVLHATIDPNGVNPGKVIVVVNHLQSFIDIELLGGVGPRVRARRTAQAESIARLLQDLQQDNANVPVIAVGDYNAFEFSDGYTDPMSVIAGTPTPGNQIVVPGEPGPCHSRLRQPDRDAAGERALLVHLQRDAAGPRPRARELGRQNLLPALRSRAQQRRLPERQSRRPAAEPRHPRLAFGP